MGNSIPCKHCGKNSTDHDENPRELTVVPATKASKRVRKLEEIVCDDYTPDIVDGEIACTCAHEHTWCTGHCNFPPPPEREQD